MNLSILNFNIINDMEAVIKKTGEKVEVEKEIIDFDGMTSYFVYVNKDTKEIYKYNELKINK